MTHKHKIDRATGGYLRYWNASASPPYSLLQTFSAKLGMMTKQDIPMAPNTPVSKSAEPILSLWDSCTGNSPPSTRAPAPSSRKKRKDTSNTSAAGSSSNFQVNAPNIWQGRTTASASKSGQYPPVNTIIRIGYVCFNVKYSAQIKFSLQKLM